MRPARAFPLEVGRLPAPEGMFVVSHAFDRGAVRLAVAGEVARVSRVSGDIVRVSADPGGRPRVEIGGVPSESWSVSFSDTHDLVLGVALRNRCVGIDVEWLDPTFAWRSVASEFFPSGLVSAWQSLPPADARREFFRAWARWEAVLKCRGTGFRDGHLGAGEDYPEVELVELAVGAEHQAWFALANA